MSDGDAADPVVGRGPCLTPIEPATKSWYAVLTNKDGATSWRKFNGW